MQETMKQNGILTSFIPLNQEEERILEMYSRGESYQIIQENLLMEYGLDYSQKKLGSKMGIIKKKMKCETQFQMGYLYGRRETFHQIAELRHSFREKIRETKITTAISLQSEASEQIKEYLSGKDFNRGVHTGLIAASIFWLIVFGLVYNHLT